MLGATQELTYYLRLFDKQNFQLETQTTKISDTLSQFANFIDEISSLYQVFFTQLNDTMMLPLNNFIDHDFDGKFPFFLYETMETSEIFFFVNCIF